VFSLAVLVLVPAATRPSMAASGFETPPVLQASDLAPAELLKGPRFHVDPNVPTDGLLAKFTIRSDFGDFEAEGPGMLGIRVGEIQALDTMSKTEKSEAFERALVGSAKRTGKSLATAVTHPVETAKGVPAGVGRFFQRVGRSVKTGAQKADDYFSGTGEEGEKTSSSEAAKEVGTAAENVIGQQDSRRRVAKVLRVDPYTTNPVLDKKLNEFAWVVWAGEFGLDYGINMVPVGMAITLTRTWVSDLVWDMKPGDLNVRAQKQLEDLGVPSETIERFLRQKAFTLTTRTALLEALATLGPGKGRTDVIPWALTAKSDAQARFIAGAVMMLADHHKAEEPITELRVSGTLLGRTKAGTLVVPAPVDYVSWTERVGAFAKRPDLAARNRQIWVTGTLSPRAHEELTRHHWVTREKVKAGVPVPGGPRVLEGTATNPSP
jgi:hypothetical protein